MSKKSCNDKEENCNQSKVQDQSSSDSSKLSDLNIDCWKTDYIENNIEGVFKSDLDYDEEKPIGIWQKIIKFFKV